MFRFLPAIFAGILFANTTYAQTALDSASVQLSGSIDDVCNVDAITSITSATVENLATSAIGGGVKVASLSFGFPVDNTTNPGALTIGEISDSSIDVAIDLYCNDEFQFTIEATNGAMVNADDVNNSGDFTNSLTYSVGFQFPDGSTAATTASSGSGGVIVFDPAVPAQDGSAVLTLNFSNAGQLKPISGLYEEALTVSFVQDGVTPPSSFSP